MQDDIDDMPDVPLNLDGSRDAEVTVTTAEEPKATETDKQEEEPKAEEKTTEGEQKPAEEQQTATDPEAAKRAENARYAAQRVQERQRIKQDTANKLDEVYGPKSQQQLEEEGLDPVQAQLQAMQEKLTYSEQRSAISELNAGLQAEAVNVQYDFPVYRELNPDGSKNPEYDPDFSKMVEDQYQRVARVTTDDNGIVLSAESSLYDFYKDMAKIYNHGNERGVSQGQQEMQQMLSRTEDATGGGSSTNKGSESLEEMGERLADVPIY